MGAPVLDESRVANLAVFGTTAGVDRHYVSDTDRGTKVVHGIAIFKSGSFKDSTGEQRTWTDEQLAMMVANFSILQGGDRLPNVPVRTDHSWSVEQVIGYVIALSVENGRLLGDVEFTEPDAFQKFDRGTYRSRSLEIGMYEDNDGVTYWPVVLGLAFVDLPAVEGLHRGAQKVGCFSYQEVIVPEKTEAPKPFTFKLATVGDTTDYAAVQAYVGQLEGENHGLRSRNETLEAYALEQTKVARQNFVKSLSDNNKIAATQVEGLTALAEGLNDDQWAAFQASYDKAPALRILGQHSNTVTNPDNTNGAPDPADDERLILEGTVAQFRRSGMSSEDIEKTPSARKLAALNGK